ncbi:MAG TPA: DUF4159 domain-containing protein [Opitutaceae bacterium]|nr:DUF4159 domain-containing protein [Opitutaceae bacterium]
MTFFRGCLLAFFALAAPLLDGYSRTPSAPTAISWARLQTPDPYWNRHQESDASLIAFMADSLSTRAEPQLKSVQALRVEDLCEFPFLYSQTIASLSNQESGNLIEYLRRGGFLFIDACRNRGINPKEDEFLDAQTAILRKGFPDLSVQALLTDHAIYTLFYKLEERPPSANKERRYPLYALISQKHVIGIIGLNGFQCGWSRAAITLSDRNVLATASAQMATNIYLYALSR